MAATTPTRCGDVLLDTLAAEFPNIDRTLAEIAELKATLILPKPVTHVVSDVHGEFKKLRHIINNASGTLRPTVMRIFQNRISQEECERFLAVLYYPHELHQYIQTEIANFEQRQAWVLTTLRRQFEVVRELAAAYPRFQIRRLAPPHFHRLFAALYDEPFARHPEGFVDAMVEVFTRAERDLDAVRAASRMVRNLSVGEIIVAGDCGDRGERIDKVIEYLMQQPNLSFVWGNHDASWMGACLGSEALIANVLRISLRYRRLFQLEEGYGLMLLPLEQLARTVYHDDPAERFQSKNSGVRDPLHVARMQKAAAIMQFKLEGQMIRRHPEWNLEHRNLLHRIDFETGEVEIEGMRYPMRDTRLPTIDPADPYALSKEEAECMASLRKTFINSARLWEHMNFLVRQGSMWLVRDHAVIIHGCVPLDANGDFVSLPVLGTEVSGREMYVAFDTIVRRCFRKGASEVGHDADWFWYLWCGPYSPLFGKDKVATFESYFLHPDKAHEEVKNPYFERIHDAEFCDRVAAEFGVAANGLLVNGHVPVRVDAGENPVKRGGNAVTIDGAFSEAYGDHGYSLLLTPEAVELAEHHHFEGVVDVVSHGGDIVPKVTMVRLYDPPRKIADTEEGVAIHSKIAALEDLVRAYEEGRIFEKAH